MTLPRTLLATTRPAAPMPRTLLMSAPDVSATLLDVRVADAYPPHVVRRGLRVRVDRGEVIIDDGCGDVRVEYADLPALIAALVVAEDELGDAR